MHAFDVQLAEVRVDPDLGEIRGSRFVGAFDGGNVLNAKTARSQLIGGIAYGIGMALLEETLVDSETGRIVSTNVAEYVMPVNADIPDIQTIIVSNDHNSNALGAKGIGRTADGRCGGGHCHRGLSRHRRPRPQSADPDRGYPDLRLRSSLLCRVYLAAIDRG